MDKYGRCTPDMFFINEVKERDKCLVNPGSPGGTFLLYEDTGTGEIHWCPILVSGQPHTKEAVYNRGPATRAECEAEIKRRVNSGLKKRYTYVIEGGNDGTERTGI